MDFWVFEKGRRLYSNGCVELDFVDSKGNSYFKVSDEDRGRVCRVKVSKGLSVFCDCVHGVSFGVRGEMCPHKLSCFYWLEKEVVDGKLNKEFFRGRSSDKKEVDVEEGVLGYELSESDKKKLKGFMCCEWCGAETGLNVHRVHRQVSYTLRNIMLLCGSCHRLVHFKEEGHRNK